MESATTRDTIARAYKTALIANIAVDERTGEKVLSETATTLLSTCITITGKIDSQRTARYPKRQPMTSAGSNWVKSKW